MSMMCYIFIYVLILNGFKMSHCKIIHVVNIIYTIFVQRGNTIYYFNHLC